MQKSLLSLLILFAFIIVACCPEQKELTTEEIAKEKEAIIKVNEDYNKASEEKDFVALARTLADEVYFFGTDSSEIIKTFADFKKAILKQWEVYDKLKYGNMTDAYIQIDKKGEFASIIFGVPCEATSKGITERLYLRIARTMNKNDKDKWVIISGIVGIARSQTLTAPAPEE